MIDVVKQTPRVYSNESRDYQVIARLYTALFNMVKMYTDVDNTYLHDVDDKLVGLRANTLNFRPKHEWDLNELNAVLSSFKYLMRKKGTKAALQACLTMLLRIEKLSGTVSEDSGTLSINGTEIEILLPEALASIGVVEDLFRYLIPAGFTYRIKQFKKFDDNKAIKVGTIFKQPTINYNEITDGTLTLYGDVKTKGGTLYKNSVVKEIGSTIDD